MTPGADLHGRLPGRVLGMLAVGLLVAAYGVQAIAVRNARNALEHDEIVTHLVVSGHLDDWQVLADGAPPLGRWEPAATYGAFLDLDDASSLDEVRANLADHDLHPPLYFWSVLFARDSGVDLLRAGLAVNIVAGAATILLLYRLIWQTFRDPAAAALGTAVFVLSPASALAASLARQYVLLGLVTTVLLWTATRLAAAAPRTGWWLALGAVTTAGMLTSYQFAFPLAGALAFLVLWPRPRSWRRVVLPPAAAAVGVAAAALIHPGWPAQLERAEALGPGFSSSELPDRAWEAFEGLLDVVSLSRWIDAFSLPAAAALTLVLAAAVRWHRPLRTYARHHPSVGAAAAIGSATVAGYLVSHATGAGPPHAVGRHYVAVLTVPLAVAAGALVAQARSVRWRAVVAVGVAAAVLVSLQWNVVHRRTSDHRRQAIAAVADASAIVADCRSGGHLPGVAIWADERADVLLLTNDDGRPPPRDLEPAETLLASSDPASCQLDRRSSMAADDALAFLGLQRGELIGYLGEVQIYRVEALAPGPTG